MGCFLGTLIGALPGLSPSNDVATLIPLAFSLKLEPASALIMLSSVYYGAMYGGRISSILLNTPGDEPVLMTTLDGYPMAKQGKAGEALATSAIASFIGGVLAISEILFFLESSHAAHAVKITVGKANVTLKGVLHTLPTSLRTSLIGFVCGVLPGAGASLGSFAAYTLEKQIVDKEGTFGTGDPRGVAAPEAGNNSAAGGALIPMLTLGVPGSGTTAVLLAMLTALNVTPRALAVRAESGRGLGTDRGAVHRQPHAAGAEPAADRAVRAGADGALAHFDAGRGDGGLRRDLLHQSQQA